MSPVSSPLSAEAAARLPGLIVKYNGLNLRVPLAFLQGSLAIYDPEAIDMAAVVQCADRLTAISCTSRDSPLQKAGDTAMVTRRVGHILKPAIGPVSEFSEWLMPVKNCSVKLSAGIVLKIVQLIHSSTDVVKDWNDASVSLEQVLASLTLSADRVAPAMSPHELTEMVGLVSTVLKWANERQTVDEPVDIPEDHKSNWFCQALGLQPGSNLHRLFLREDFDVDEMVPLVLCVLFATGRTGSYSHTMTAEEWSNEIIHNVIFKEGIANVGFLNKTVCLGEPIVGGTDSDRKAAREEMMRRHEALFRSIRKTCEAIDKDSPDSWFFEQILRAAHRKPGSSGTSPV